MKKVTAAILINNGKVLIAKRKATEKLGNMWEFPGGKIEDGETPEECLKREIREEFNIDIEVGNFFGESIYQYKHGAFQLLAFFASWKNGDLSPTVHEEYRWVPIKELSKFDFLPADIPLVNKLEREHIGI
jgi:8-oxo-dGTP diphosphatase